MLACLPGVESLLHAQDNTFQPRMTYIDLIHRLTDLEHLATLPPPGEKTAQFSSYDRASRYDESTGKYIHWDANGDNNGIIRKEGDKEVLAEMEGPGCIWRIWSAAPKQGHVRIYLDGNHRIRRWICRSLNIFPAKKRRSRGRRL